MPPSLDINAEITNKWKEFFNKVKNSIVNSISEKIDKTTNEDILLMKNKVNKIKVSVSNMEHKIEDIKDAMVKNKAITQNTKNQS